MYCEDIKITVESGLHTRYSAMLVNKASEISYKYKVKFYIKKNNYSDWLEISMLGLLALKISKDEILTIGTTNTGMIGKLSINLLIDYINNNINHSTEPMEAIDDFIEENSLANEQLFDVLPIGVMTIDLNSSITKINKYALQILNLPKEKVLGNNIRNIIPNTELPDLLKTQTKEIGKILYLGNRTTIVNRSPLYHNGDLIGATAVIQDISQMIGLKELNEKFTRILENSSDLICFVDEYGKINYINPAYKKYFKNSCKNIIGKDIFSVSPKGYRARAFTEKKPINNVIHNKEGIDIITKVVPIFVDDKFKGIISTSKPINELKKVITQLEKSREELKYYKDEFFRNISSLSSFSNIIGYNSGLKDVIYICEKASQSTSTVLIRGESGTGKELIAKAIHNNSTRKTKPFVKVNCAAIPENLLESELFGYEKGSFTGAIKSKPGKFVIANGGTIFLDEIGDMPVSMQIKLLRVIQEREVESIGAIKPQKIDVRIIAATNRNLEKMMSSGEFREDLYYRLNVLSVSLPPLRHRKEDINSLIEHFIEKINHKLNKSIESIDKKALKALQSYEWPGNIRELENIIERAINLCDSNIITLSDLPSYLNNSNDLTETTFEIDENNILTFEEYEKKIIETALRKYKSFNKTGQALGLTHRTISLKCKKYGIEVQK
ncbi:sigma 54-interacting transcriptional regulator [Clostridium sp.]|uniref:sigma 54-interacting transcriptional regulator n=1 Tax=Clostridium sp. TaxID=1506 RepID=UPI00399433D5